MQQPQTRGRLVYASLGLRTVALLIDTAILFVLLVFVFGIAASAGYLDITNVTYAEALTSGWTPPTWTYVAMYGLVFVYYTLFEALAGGSIGKLALQMRVTMDDGTPATGAAIVIRNLVRIPEMLFWYAPAAIACLASDRNKRLGDLLAHTVVVQREPTFARVTRFPPTPPPPPPTPPTADRYPAPTAPTPAETLATLKTAALAVRGAHHNYYRLSEAELAREAVSGDGSDETASEAPEYSPEYVAAWYTLGDAVAALHEARAAVETAARDAGTTFAAALTSLPDLAHLADELAPYFDAVSDDEIHAAYVRVARDALSRSIS